MSRSQEGKVAKVMDVSSQVAYITDTEFEQEEEDDGGEEEAAYNTPEKLKVLDIVDIATAVLERHGRNDVEIKHSIRAPQKELFKEKQARLH